MGNGECAAMNDEQEKRPCAHTTLETIDMCRFITRSENSLSHLQLLFSYAPPRSTACDP